MENIEDQQQVNVEDALQNLFKTSSGSEENEMIRVATEHTLQLSNAQIKILLWLEIQALQRDNTMTESDKIRTFNRKYLEMKKHNNSAYFVIKIVEAISKGNLINENTLKLNIDKKA